MIIYSFSHCYDLRFFSLVLNMSAFKWRIAKFVCCGCHFSLKYCEVSHGVDNVIETYLKGFMARKRPVGECRKENGSAK